MTGLTFNMWIRDDGKEQLFYDVKLILFSEIDVKFQYLAQCFLSYIRC